MSQTNQAEAIRIRPVTRRIGAEIEGVDLTQPLGDAAFDVIYQAFLRWKVIFFRDQDISSEQHLAFARRFGELEVHPISPTVPGERELLLLARGASARNGEDEFHADVTFQKRPPKCSVLRGIDVPEYGGDTIWIDMAAAYEGLPASTRALLDGLHGVHDFEPVFGHRLTPERLLEMRSQHPPMQHPVVVRHPETGERILYVNRLFTTHLLDTFTVKKMTRASSEALLTELFNTVTVPENQVRFRWRKNSMAIWDNRATQHYAVYDYADPEGKEVRRVMHRATAKSPDRPAA